MEIEYRNKELLSLKDLEKPLDVRSEQIATLFESEIENYYYLYSN